MLLIAATNGFGLSPEAWNAIIIALLGSFGTFVVSRYTAKRQADREDSDDGARFRGELRDDNVSLRQEIRDLKDERDRLQDRIDALSRELRIIYTERITRGKADVVTEQRLVELERGNDTSKK